MIDNNYNSLFTSFLITVIAYVLPMVIVRMNGPLCKKKAHWFAFWNSIIIASIFIMIRGSNGISGGSSTPAVLYYFINKSILRSGFKGNEVESTKGAGTYNIKETDSTLLKDNFDYKKLYQSLDNDMKKLVFQSGFEDFISVLQSMKYLLGNEYSYMELINIYVDIWMGLEGNEPKEVVSLIQSQYAYKHISEKASTLTSYIVNHKKDNSYTVVPDEIHSKQEASIGNLSNEDIKNEDFRKLYESLDPKLSSYIFPDGYNEFRIILNSLKYLFGNRYTTTDLVKIYSSNWVRTAQSDADEVARRIKLSNELKNDEDKIDIFIAFILIHKNNTSFELNDNQTLTMTKMLADSFKESVKYKEKNNAKIIEFIHDMDYGKVSHKPIYIDGFKGSEKFIKSLRFENGDKLKCERKGSIPSDGGSVDIYEIENENTHVKEILYVNLYSNNNEYYVPKGYVLVSTDNDNIKDVFSNKESKTEKQNIQPISRNDDYAEKIIQDQNKIEAKVCLKCNKKNPFESKYCSNCGNEFLSKAYCKKCGSKINEGSKFCNMCGSRI